MIYRASPDAPEKAAEIAKKYDVRCVVSDTASIWTLRLLATLTRWQAYKCDVSNQAEIQKLMGEIYHDVGPVGGVVCSAGVGVEKPAIDMTKEDFDAQFNPNVWGCFTVAQAAAK